MQKQSSTTSAPAERPPWTPLGVSLIALFMPAGGAILTIQNLVRLGEIDPKRGRELSLAAIGVFAVGLTVLLVLAPHRAGVPPQPDQNAVMILALGTAAAAYLAQRSPYVAWRRQHATAKTSFWLRALIIGIGYDVLIALLVVPLRLLIALIAYALGWSAGEL